MLAAADAAEDKGDPPPELQMAWDAAGFNIPPVSGGRYDQPAGLLKKMRILSRIYDAMAAAREYNRNQRVQDFQKHPLFDTYISITKLRQEHG